MNKHQTISEVMQTSVIKQLRLFKFELFVTGSRVYGTPTETSDWDFVVLAKNVNDAKHIKQILHDFQFRHGGSGYDGYLRFGFNDWISYKSPCGDLNVIVVAGRPQFEKWQVARDWCCDHSPLSKPECIAAHERFGAGVNELTEVLK